MEIVFRLGLALLISAALVTLYWGWTRLQLLRVGSRSPRSRIDEGLENLQLGTPAILYFTTPTCIPCRTVQGPAIEALAKRYGKQLQVIKIDAAERPDLADSWGVLSVPTTFIIDRKGRPRQVNHGVALASKLDRQLRAVR